MTHSFRRPDEEGPVSPHVEAMIADLERQMPALFQRNVTVFSLANAWAERHDAILARAASDERERVEARLARIGIRWGLMPGSRVTMEFCSADVAALAAARRRRGG